MFACDNGFISSARISLLNGSNLSRNARRGISSSHGCSARSRFSTRGTLVTRSHHSTRSRPITGCHYGNYSRILISSLQITSVRLGTRTRLCSLLWALAVKHHPGHACGRNGP